MSANIVTRLLLDNKDYEEKLGKAKKSAGDFSKTLTSGVGAALKGVNGYITIAKKGFEEFGKLMQSSQTTADAFDIAMRSCRTVVNEFKTALVTADFSSFAAGLNEILNGARATAAALDQLGNTTWSYGRFNAQNQADFQQEIAVMRDKEASSAARSQAKTLAQAVIDKQREITEVLRADVDDAVKNLVTEGNHLGVEDVTAADVDNILRIDVSKNRQELKDSLEKQYNEYKAKVAELERVNTTFEKPRVGTFSTGMAQAKTDTEAIAEGMKDLNAQYKDAILYNEILVKKGDEWLKELIATQTSADNAERTLASMEKTLNRASTSTNKMVVDMSSVAIQAGRAVGIMGKMAGLPGYTSKKQAAVIPTLENGAGIAGKQYEVTADVERARQTLAEGSLATGMELIAEEQVTRINEASSALGNIADIMGTLSGVVDESASSWLSWGAGVLEAIAKAIPMIGALVAAEGAEATASGVGAVGKSASEAAAGGPVAAIAAAVSVAAAIAAAMASIPKFAGGGTVPGTSWTGDNMLIRVNSGERVVPRDQTIGMGGARVEFVIKDRQLYGLLDNYEKLRGRRL